MLGFPLSRYDKKLLKEFETILNQTKTPSLIPEEVTKYKDIIDSMKALGTIRTSYYDNKCFISQHNFDAFKQWVMNEDKKSRRPAKREIGIAVFSVTASAIVSIVTTLLTLFIKGI